MDVAQHTDTRNASQSALGPFFAYRAYGPHVMYLQWTGGYRINAKELASQDSGCEAPAPAPGDFAHIAQGGVLSVRGKVAKSVQIVWSRVPSRTKERNYVSFS